MGKYFVGDIVGFNIKSFYVATEIMFKRTEK